MGTVKVRHWVKAADILFGSLIVFPLEVFYWRGTWDIWEHYVNLDCRDEDTGGNATLLRPAHLAPGRNGPRADFPCDDQGGHWVSGIAGCAAMVLINIFSPLLIKHVRPEKVTWAGYVIISRLYFWVFGFAYMGHWRGVWGLTDHYDEDMGWRQNLFALVPTYGLAFVLRCSRMASSAPYQVSFDIPSGESFKKYGHAAVFKSYTWFESSIKQNGLWFYCIDHTLSMLIPLSISILIWRCYWNVLDDTFIVGDQATTWGVSIATGFGVIIVCMLLSEPAAHVSAKLDKHPLIFKVIFEDICYVIIGGGIVLIWRGAWYLVAEYILPDPVVGGWTCHAIGFVGLSLTCSCVNTYDNSTDLDGDYDNGDGVRPTFGFFNYFFRKRIEEERLTEEMAEAQADNKVRPTSISMQKEGEINFNYQAEVTNTSI